MSGRIDVKSDQDEQDCPMIGYPTKRIHGIVYVVCQIHGIFCHQSRPLRLYIYIYVSLSTSWWLGVNLVETLELGPHEKAEILDADMICWDKQE